MAWLEGVFGVTMGRSVRTGISGFLLLTLLCQLSSSPALADDARVIELNNQGVNALNKSNFSAAITSFEAALKIDPSYKMARDNLAIAYNNYGLSIARSNPKQALQLFHKALSFDRNNATTMQNVDGIVRMLGKNPKSFADRAELGDQSRKAGDFVGAIIEYQEALKIKDDAPLHEKLGDVFRVQGQDDKAIAEYQAAARTNDTAAIEVKLGQAFQAKGDIPNGIAAYGKAISMKPDDPDVLDALVAGWEAAIAKNPTAADNHVGLGQAFQYRGDFGQAEAEYNMAIRLSPGKQNPTAQKLLAGLADAKRKAQVTKHINNGVDLQQRKMYDQALAEYQLALQADPRNEDALMNMGTLYQQKGDFDKALAFYNQTLQINPKNEGAQQGIKTATAQKQEKALDDAAKNAGDLYKAGKWDEAINAYRKLIQLDSSDAAPHFNIGACYQGKYNQSKNPADIDNAIAEYRIACQMDKDNKEYAKTLDIAMDVKAKPIIDAAIKKHSDKDYAGAIDLYQQALAIRPRNAELYFNLAGAQYAREDYAKAKDAYVRALDIDPAGQVGDLYLIGVIDEHFGNGAEAVKRYRDYLQKQPTGKYAGPAKERLDALNKDITATLKIKSEAQLAQEKAAGDQYKQAVDLQNAEKYDEAIDIYQKIKPQFPKDPAYPYAIGTAYQKKAAKTNKAEDFDAAIAAYMEAQALDPKNPQYQALIDDCKASKADPLIQDAVAKQTAGDNAAAIALYQQALQILPPKNSATARVWTNLGGSYQQSDQFNPARDAYQKGYDLDPKGEVDNLVYMAAIDENNGQGQRALAGYQKYIQVAPTGKVIGDAKDRSKALTANISNTKKLATQADRAGAATAQTAYDEGMKAFQAKDFDGAIAGFTKAANAMPKELAYASALGNAYQAKGDIANAVAWYQKALPLATTAEQKKTLNDLIAGAYGQQAAPLLNSAAEKFQKQDYAGAIPDYEKVLTITPQDASTMTFLASCYQQIDDYQKARDMYKKAIQTDPKGQAQDWYFVGILDEHFSQAAQAISDYKSYIAAQPAGPYAAIAKERIAVLTKDPNQVQHLVTQVQAKQSADAQNAYNEAVNLQTAQKYDESIAKYLEAIKISPNEASYYGSLGTCYQAKGDLDNAIAMYEKAKALKGTEPNYTAWLAGAKSAKAQPLRDAGWAKIQANPADAAGARADFQAALKLSEDAGTYNALGAACFMIPDHPGALAAYQKAVQLDPKGQVESWYWIGLIYEAMKQPKLAAQAFQKYVQGAPTGQYAADAKTRIKNLTPAAPGRR